jgi:hypothetical protein
MSTRWLASAQLREAVIYRYEAEATKLLVGLA